jgi:hypothetical protein
MTLLKLTVLAAAVSSILGTVIVLSGATRDFPATDNDQWNYVNTKLNPADLASRGMNVLKFLQSPQWFRGPDFLWLPEDDCRVLLI